MSFIISSWYKKTKLFARFCFVRVSGVGWHSVLIPTKSGRARPLKSYSWETVILCSRLSRLHNQRYYSESPSG